MNLVSDRRAQLFAIDLLLAFIPLTIMLGMSANALSGVALQTQSYVNIYSLQRRTNDAADILVKSPGTPPNWNSTIHPTVSGLAYYDNSSGRPYTNRIFSTKIYALTASDLENLTGSSNSYLNTSFITLQTSYAVGSDAPENAIDIAVAERYSNLQFSGDFGPFLEAEDITSDSGIEDGCQNVTGGSGSGGACVYDNVTDLDTGNGEFYLYISGSSAASGSIWLSNGTDNVEYISENDFTGGFCQPATTAVCNNQDLEEDCKLSTDKYFKVIWTVTGGTEFTPSQTENLNSEYSPNPCNNVLSWTLIIELEEGFIQSFNELAIESNAASNEPMDIYGIKIPAGTPWDFVSPTAFPNIMYPVKLTLKVWT